MMNSVVFMTLLAASSVSGRILSYPFVPHITASQYHAQDELGRASFGYAYPGQARASYQDAYGNQIGSWAYINAEGKEVKVSYVADSLGFRVLSNDLPISPVAAIIVPSIALNLPQPVEETPEVAAARSALMAAHDEAKKALADAVLKAESSSKDSSAEISSEEVEHVAKDMPAIHEEVAEDTPASSVEDEHVAEETPVIQVDVRGDTAEETIHDTYAAASVDLLTSY